MLGVLSSLFLGTKEQHLGVRLFLWEALQPPAPPVERTQRNSSVGSGEGWLHKPWRDRCLGTQDENWRLVQRAGGCSWGGKVQEHQSHSEYDTMGRTGDREEIKTKQMVFALDSLAP